ncbi:hypothetical protein OKW37_005023 [Paraburkholderia sp. MM5482-R2]
MLARPTHPHGLHGYGSVRECLTAVGHSFTLTASATAHSFCYTSYRHGLSWLQRPFESPAILGAVSLKQRPDMSKKIIQMVAVAALSAAASLPALAGDMNNMLGGALGGVAGAAVGGAVGGSTGAVIGGAVGGGAGGAVTSNRHERTGAIIGGALGGGAGTAAGNAMGGRTGGLVGAALGGGAGSALGGNISRSNSYANDYSRGHPSGKHHHKHRRYD